MNDNHANPAIQQQLQKKFAAFKEKTDAHFAAFQEELTQLVKTEMKRIEVAVRKKEASDLEILLEQDLAAA